MTSCYFCDHPETEDSKYTIGAMKLILSSFKTCTKCTGILELRVKEAPKKYVLEKQFIPKQIETKPNYQDREPGEEG